MADEADVEVDDVSEEDVQEDVVYSVNSFGADFLVDGLISRLNSDDIYRPSFQRKFVWSLPQASRFIESILLGLPIPGIFLYREDKTRKHLIIDGLQRLTTISSFASGRFPGTDKVFKLVKLKSKFDGKSIEELADSDRRRFFDTAIHATIIQQIAPDNDSSSAYYIFERLNTGGTPLQPEEIRAALYHGDFQEFLVELNTRPIWRKIFGPEHKRSKDQELILRFLAFRYRRNIYKAPMKTFLNKFMEYNRDLSRIKSDEMERVFISTLEFIVSAVGEKPFRPTRVLNAAAFDSVSVIASENLEKIKLKPNEFEDRYNKLMKDEDYLKLITRSTADDQSVRDRFELAEKYLLA